MRLFLRLLLVVSALAVLAGCQTEGFLEVQVDEDGGGAVYLALAMDQEAADRTVLFESRPPDGLPIADLARAGWVVTGPTVESDGRVWMRAQKSFSQLDQLPGVIAEVAGPGGPFQDFEVTRSSDFGDRSWTFRGTVDLTGGLAAFSDADLAAALNGQPLGQPAEGFEQQLGAPLESFAKLNVVVDLPGSVGQNNGTVGRAGVAAPTTVTTAPADQTTTPDAATPLEVRASGEGAAVVWNPSFADPPTELQAASQSRLLLPRLWRWLAILAGVVGAVALAYQLSRLVMDSARERRRTAVPGSRPIRHRAFSEPLPTPTGRFAAVGAGAVGSQPHGPGLRTEPVTTSTPGAANGAPTSEPVPGGPPGLGLIVIETSGTLFTGGDSVGDVLVPFVRDRGCVLSVRQISDLYLARAVGGMAAADFWTALGLSGDTMLLDDAFAQRFELTDHVLAFLSQARRRGVAVAAVGDDVPEWTSVYRQRFKLDGLIGTWVSSAEVGVRIPHPALLEAVAKLTGHGPSDAMVIGSTRSLLDAARRLGYRTVHYIAGGEPSTDHPVLRSFVERDRPIEETAAP